MLEGGNATPAPPVLLCPRLSWFGASLVAQMVKNLPERWETQIPFLDQKDPLEKEMAAHPSILTWEIPWTEEPGGPQSMGWQGEGHD